VNFVYILRCGDGSYYTGWTNNPARRLQAHQSGKGSRYTRSHLPVELVYLEECETKQQAMAREYAIKQLKKEDKRKMIAAQALPENTNE